MTEIITPKLIRVDQIKSDDTNPNRMNEEQFNALKEGINKFGFLVPVITNKDLVIADGYHRWKAAKELGMEQIQVVVLDMNEVDRKVIRQIMNKLKGEHKLEKDINEFEFIKNEGGMNDLVKLMGKDKAYFDDIIKLKDVEMEQYLVVRELDEKIRAESIAGNKQIKLKLTDEQKIILKEKFNTDKKVLQIIDYFLVVE